MAPARPVGEAFFPLDEQLGLLGGVLTPRGEETLARLASWMPFEAAGELLEELMGVRVSKATARRATLATGTAARAVWEAEVERLKQEAPQAPDGADKQAMSGEGAFVHLVGGEWVARQDADDWRGHAQLARGSVHAAGLLLFAAGGRRALCGSSLGRNASTRGGTGDRGVRRARWRPVEAWAGRLPPSGCRAPLGFCACCLIPQRDRAGRASRGRQAAGSLAGRRAASAQTSGTSARAEAPQVVGRSLSQSHRPGQPGLFAEA